MSKTGKKVRILTCLVAMFMLFGTIPVCAAEKTVEAKIPVSSTGKNTKESFSYHLKAETSEFQTLATDSLSLRDGETGSFSVLYTYPGTYHYTISQEKGTDKKTTYDETVYNVDVYVTEDEDGEMSAEPVIYLNGSNGKKQSASFVNTKELDAIKTTGNVETDAIKTTGNVETDTIKTTGNVKTGDTSNTAFWIVTLGLSATLMGIMILKRKKKEDR